MRKKVVVYDLMQSGYVYYLTEPAGQNFDAEFHPQLTPSEMLHLGIFGGKYMTDCQNEFPKDWFTGVRLCHQRHVPEYNFFGVNASQPLSVWRNKGWINQAYDPRGWFQWYCRYYLGRGLLVEDKRQIKRWKAFARHLGQIRKKCPSGALYCRRRQRQALLHWAYDSRNI